MAHANALVAAAVTPRGAYDGLRHCLGGLQHAGAWCPHEQVCMAQPSLARRHGEELPHTWLLGQAVERRG